MGLAAAKLCRRNRLAEARLWWLAEARLWWLAAARLDCKLLSETEALIDAEICRCCDSAAGGENLGRGAVGVGWPSCGAPGRTYRLVSQEDPVRTPFAWRVSYIYLSEN